MTEPGPGEPTFSNKDAEALIFFADLKNKGPKAIEPYIQEVPAGSNINCKVVAQEARWVPIVLVGEKTGREMLLLFQGKDGYRYGAKTVKAALEFPVEDRKADTYKLLYPRFDHDNKFEPTNSAVLVLSKSQFDSLKNVLKNS